MRSDFDKLERESSFKKDVNLAKWEKDFGEKYREKYDNYVILTMVCMDLFNESECVPEDPWHEPMDVRRREFHDDFVAEV
jgi:hypothetical protein